MNICLLHISTTHTHVPACIVNVYTKLMHVLCLMCACTMSGARMHLTARNETYMHMHVCSIASEWSYTNSLSFLICIYNPASKYQYSLWYLIFNTWVSLDTVWCHCGPYGSLIISVILSLRVLQ